MPAGIRPPVLGPIASTMGEIMLISMTSKTTSAMELRSLADWVIRPRLLGVPGVAQVMIIGGETKQYQVLVDPAKLRDYNLTLKEVSTAVGAANVNASGGFLERPDLEYFIRARGRVNTLDDLANSVIAVRNTTPILVKNIADVRIGPALKRGDGSFNMHSDVVATIQKQPNANTLEVTGRDRSGACGVESNAARRCDHRHESISASGLHRPGDRQSSSARCSKAACSSRSFCSCSSGISAPRSSA